MDLLDKINKLDIDFKIEWISREDNVAGIMLDGIKTFDNLENHEYKHPMTKKTIKKISGKKHNKKEKQDKLKNYRLGIRI